MIIHWRNPNTTLKLIKNNINPYPNPGLTRKEEIVINRLRIGLTTVSLLLKKEPSCDTYIRNFHKD